MSNTVAVAMIVGAGKDEDAAPLAKCLGSFNGYVDGIYIQLNTPKGVPVSKAVRAVAEQFTKHVFVAEWKEDFVGARNAIFAKVPKKYDWIMWADYDDVISNPKAIKPSATIMPKDVKGVHILYDYQKDEWGNVIVAHWSNRMVRNDGTHTWKSSFDDVGASVHETLVPKHSVRTVSNDEWKVVHDVKAEHFKDSLIRNIHILEGMALRQQALPGGVDPRILFYLGSHYNEAYRFREAKDYFIKYLQLSGWAEERAEAHVYIGKILEMEDNSAQARNAFLMALGENPENSGAYLGLAKLEAKGFRWEQSASWAKRGMDVKQAYTSMIQYNNDYDLYTTYANACSNLGGKYLKLAQEYAQKAVRLRPEDPNADANFQNIQALIRYRDNLRAVARLLNTLRSDKEDAKILPFLDTLPEQLVDSQLVVQNRMAETPAKVWPKQSIAIYVGPSAMGIWGPLSLDNGGIGGSEEAVVRLSRELVKLGWNVDVFATPPARTSYDSGVHWHQYWEFNPKDTFDVLIGWRNPGFFDIKFKARKKYLWLHDVIEKEELTKARIKNVIKIIYVSKYHSNRPESSDVPSNKRFISGNGITSDDFIQCERKQLRRDNHRCIYMSANERGLRILYEIWPDVRTAVPGATLDIYYGWHSFDAINKDNPERMAWKASMNLKLKELKSLGVTDHGRVGQDQIVQEIFKAGIWAYPSFFPEVNCITGQKAMAGGAQPVTSDFAALYDLIPEEYGTKVSMGEFTEQEIGWYRDALIDALKYPMLESKRKEMMMYARQKFDWSSTAKGWAEEMA